MINKILDMKKINKILVIRFRQIGDAVLSMALCSTLKRTFPEAEIHFVLNKGIAPLFMGHRDIDKIISFDSQELKSPATYIKKVWRVVNEGRYDVIIDMRSTVRTLLFSLLSLRSPFRIGRKKNYAKLLLNYQIDNYDPALKMDMVRRDLLLVEPLSKVRTIQNVDAFSLMISDDEKLVFRKYMEENGIDFHRPVMLVGVTTKISTKKWNSQYMVELLRDFIRLRNDIQLIFNYAPGEEERDAWNIYQSLGAPDNIRIEIKASSLRQLGAMCANCSCYFGNEGGSRHIAQAVGIPSLAIFSPSVEVSDWLPKTDVVADSISVNDITLPENDSDMSYEDIYNKITPELVLAKLKGFIERIGI